MTKRYKIYTLGCKLNYAESSTIARRLEGDGLVMAKSGQSADMVVINSCAVTLESEHKTRETIRRVVRENPDAEVIVTGCYAKLREAEIMAIAGVSRVVTQKELTAYSTAGRTRSFLKVQDGCDFHCTYCTVWRARGASRNAPIVELVAAAREIAASGAREIVLTGVNIGDFGRTTGESFLDLLMALEKVDGVERYRISSIEPNLLTDEVIAFCAHSPKFMPHYHIPLQSGSNEVLRRMGRRYTAEFFAAKIESIRHSTPDVFIGVDVIVGFPGETQAQFMETYNVLKTVRPAFLHVFPYSARPDTLAATLADQLDAKIKKERAAQLGALCVELLDEFTAASSGKTHSILIEGRAKNGKLFGHTENYIRQEIDGGDELINTIVRR
ncbi:MAG: MiaB/RimO family radical SAM methylthiotransferase [Mucinivorans sp.]